MKVEHYWWYQIGQKLNVELHVATILLCGLPMVQDVYY